MIKAIFRAVAWVITSAFKLIFKIINKLKLWLLIAYLAICGIIQLTSGYFTQAAGNSVIFWSGFVIVVCITVFAVLFSLSKQWRKNAPPKEPRPKKDKTAYPKYYTVEGNGDFFMAEYKDRYELYHMDGDGKLTFIRTDKKKDKKEEK